VAGGAFPDRTASYCWWNVIFGHVGPYETRFCNVAYILVRTGTVGTALTIFMLQDLVLQQAV